MGEQQPKTIAILGGNGVVGQALALLLEGVGSETTILEASPTGLAEGVLRDVHLLLICAALSAARREESLALLRSAKERVDELVREIEGAFEAAVQEPGPGLAAAESLPAE